jgi:hypothetical protein
MSALATLSASRAIWRIKRIMRALSWPGLVGIALLAGTAASYWMLYLPQRDTVAELRNDALSLRRKVAARHVEQLSRDPSAQLGEFYRFFPDVSTVPDALGGLFEDAAAEALALDQGEYRLAPETGSRLLRYDMTLPARGSYIRMRHFIARALQNNPNLALESVSFGRTTAIDMGVEAQLRMTLYVRGTAP